LRLATRLPKNGDKYTSAKSGNKCVIISPTEETPYMIFDLVKERVIFWTDEYAELIVYLQDYFNPKKETSILETQVGESFHIFVDVSGSFSSVVRESLAFKVLADAIRNLKNAHVYAFGSSVRKLTGIDEVYKSSFFDGTNVECVSDYVRCEGIPLKSVIIITDRDYNLFKINVPKEIKNNIITM
jgi:hypothetical protein